MPEDITSAAQAASIRRLLPSWLGTEEMRSRIADKIRAQAVFSARVGQASVLQAIKEVIDEVTRGEMDEATARWLVLETVKATGYTPEGGFPDAPAGAVPPAVRGSLQDLTSKRRLDLIVRTQADLMRGRGLQVRGSAPARLLQYPAWELVRVGARRIPRDWQSRWVIAGGKLVGGRRMIALKGDPIWGELGASGNFPDALDVDYPPFAFNSGMGWRDVSARQVRGLGITGPEGETYKDWISEEHPTLVGTQTGLPPARADVSKFSPEILAGLRGAGIRIVDGTATLPEDEDLVKRQLGERAAAREQRKRERERMAVDRAAEAYAERGEP